jgi:hypothetical protein
MPGSARLRSLTVRGPSPGAQLIVRELLPRYTRGLLATRPWTRCNNWGPLAFGNKVKLPERPKLTFGADRSIGGAKAALSSRDLRPPTLLRPLASRDAILERTRKRPIGPTRIFGATEIPSREGQYALAVARSVLFMNQTDFTFPYTSSYQSPPSKGASKLRSISSSSAFTIPSYHTSSSNSGPVEASIVGAHSSLSRS